MDFPRKEAPILDSSVKELQFQILDWYIPENDRNKRKLDEGEEPDEYTMMIYGATQEGYTVAVNVVAYEPYFYIKPPETWETYSDSRFQSEVSSLSSQIENGTYKATFKDKKYDRKILQNYKAYTY